LDLALHLALFAHLFLALTILTPRVFVEAIVEIFSDVSTRFEPRLLFIVLRVKLHHCWHWILRVGSIDELILVHLNANRLHWIRGDL
jgi:hypothetical protein